MAKITFHALGNIADLKGPHVMSMGLLLQNELINSIADGIPGGIAKVFVDDELVDTVDLAPKVAYNINKLCPAGVGSVGRVEYFVGEELIAKAFISDRRQAENAAILGGSTYLYLGDGYRVLAFVAIGNENFPAENISFAVSYAYGIPYSSLTAITDRDGNELYRVDQNANSISADERKPFAAPFQSFEGWSDFTDLSPSLNATLMSDRGADGAVFFARPFAEADETMLSLLGDGGTPPVVDPTPAPEPESEDKSVAIGIASFVGGFVTSRLMR